MTEFKLVISDPKTGKTVQRALSEDDSAKLIGVKIGNTIKGETVGLAGYEFLMTGGSDHCGFPMRGDVSGPIRKKVCAVEGVGISKKDKGVRQRKRVAPNNVMSGTAQINVKITKYGKEKLFEKVESPKEEKAAEDAPAKKVPVEKPAKEEKPPKEEAPETPAEEAPKEKKEDPPKESEADKEKKE